MVTAIDQKEYLAEVIKHGAFDYITKTFEDSRVASAIEKCFVEDESTA